MSITHKRIIITVLTILIGVLTIHTVVTPIYTLKGSIEGVISLTNYNLEAYKNPIKVPDLERSRIISYAILINATIITATGGILLLGVKQDKIWERGVESLVGEILTSPLMITLLIISIKTITRAVKQLPLDKEYVETTAGIIHLGTTQVYTDVSVSIIIPLIISLTLVLVTLLVEEMKMLFTLTQEEQGASHPSD